MKKLGSVTMFTTAERAKLPKWAQEKIAELEQELDRSHSAAAILRREFEDSGDVFAWASDGGFQMVPIAVRSASGFGEILLDGDKGLEHGGWRVQVSADGTELEIFSPWNSRGLNILPHVSNHITVRGNYDGC